MGNGWRTSLQTFAMGVAALAFFTLVLFAGYFIGKSGGFYDAEANGYAAQYRAATQPRVDDCFRQGQSPNTTARCVEEAINSDHEEQRSEHNLDAQRQMADWAWWLLIVNAVQTPVTMIGILLLLRNIQQAEAANEISRQAMIAENRAWMEIVPNFTLGDFRYQEDNGGEFRINTIGTIQNIGKTVALNVGYTIALIPDPTFLTETSAVAEFRHGLLSRWGPVDTYSVFPGRDLPREVETGALAESIRVTNFPDREAFMPALCIGIRYNTIFDREGDPPHITLEVVSLRRLHEGRPSRVFVGRDTIPKAELGLMRSLRNFTEVT